MARKAQKLVGIMVRLPEPLRRELSRLAAASGRSLNSEIIRRLLDSVEVESPLSPDARRVVNRFETRVMERLIGRVEEGMKRRTDLENELLRALMRVAPEEAKKVIAQVYGEEGKS